MAEKFNKSFKTENIPGGSLGGLDNTPSQDRVTSDTAPGVGAYVPEKQEEQIPEIKYSDVANVPWAEKAIVELSKKGIISGYGNSEFRPDNMVTRAEFVKMIATLLGIEGNPNEALFADVISTDWYAPYVNAAANEGIVTGSENSLFNPTGNISREDAAVIIYRALSKNKSFDIEKDFTDSALFSGYAAEAIRKLAGAGVISGMGNGTFVPKETLTRAQAAVLIYGASGINAG